MSIQFVIAGPRGKMGSEVVKMVSTHSEYQIAAFLDHDQATITANEKNLSHIPIYSDVNTCFRELNIDILIDFTNPEASFQYTKSAIQNNVHAVVGTTGISSEQINELKQLAADYDVGCVIAPNFALGAVLMMEFAKIAAKYFPNVEIIDKHHDQKIDAPSGTAIKTAQLIQQSRQSQSQGHPEEYETIDHARGAQFDGMNIHSIRLPGHIAHHEVIFGGEGQTLSIKHNSIHRESFMSGLNLAINKVMNLHGLVYGLDNLLDHE